MSRFFLAMGGFAFIAMGFALVGLVYSNQTTVWYEPVRKLARNEWKMFEFLDYEDFPGFAAHCCCKEQVQNHNATMGTDKAMDRVEEWLCDNGFTKLRQREGILTDSRGIKKFFNGSQLRPFCGRSYPKGYCPPSYNADKGRYKVRACNISQITQKWDIYDFDVMSTLL